MKLKTILDKQLFLYLMLFYTVTVLLGIVRKVYWKVNGLFNYEKLSWYDLFTYNIFLDWVIVIFFMLIIAYLTKLMFDKKFHWKIIILIHTFFSFFIGYFIFSIAAIVLYFFEDFTFKQVMNNLSLDHFIHVILLNFLIYFSMTGIIMVYYYIKRVKNIEIHNSNLQSQLSTNKLNILRAQLHPHFMFNTLNSISSLMEIDVEKSQNLIADFGDLFRGLMEFNDNAMIPLQKELEFLDKYIDIISVRFSDHLVVQKKIENNLEDAIVPSMIIQPIIENAVKHAYSYNKTELEIILSIYKEGNYLHIKIANNGEPLNAHFKNLLSNGTGLKTTQERLKTIYKNDFQFTLENIPHLMGVMASIKIPYKV